jgi:hypothetical protein
VFGVLSLAALVVLIGSGTILSLKGPAWWHYTGIGHFFNSIHLWAVELFFFFMVIHLWGKYWMAAWRGGKRRTWMTGAVTFLVAIPCALTGYVSQQNFDAQWISTQAKDAPVLVTYGPGRLRHHRRERARRHKRRGNLLTALQPQRRRPAHSLHRLQKLFGVSHPIDTARDFVLAPLSSIAGQPALQSAVATYRSAGAKQDGAWTTAYTTRWPRPRSPRRARCRCPRATSARCRR